MLVHRWHEKRSQPEGQGLKAERSQDDQKGCVDHNFDGHTLGEAACLEVGEEAEERREEQEGEAVDGDEAVHDQDT